MHMKSAYHDDGYRLDTDSDDVLYRKKATILRRNQQLQTMEHSFVEDATEMLWETCG